MDLIGLQSLHLENFSILVMNCCIPYKLFHYPLISGTLTVNVNVLLLSLASPDESSLKYEVEFLLNQQWYDPRLRYANQSKYEFLNAIHHHEDIWLPDTYFIMHGDFKDPLIPMHFALRIYRNGTITYAMRRHLILSCQGSLNIFPFDDPLCSFAMESSKYLIFLLRNRS
ncbi:unnamed protein product [Hermetia illucens]|uniref:Neurotransmitter-gated ion-channel ligand-binding domain-containing protein n=1 Tax=Hermetia illucens TaxID=343691 RepID=A0A7R8UJ05_HERIL|nr:unnamed protein product [Hermetia illucens]